MFRKTPYRGLRHESRASRAWQWRIGKTARRQLEKIAITVERQDADE
jgi:hypothetical protein